MPRHTSWGGYFKEFGDEIPLTPETSTETNPDIISSQKAMQDTESTVYSPPEEPTITQEPGFYPAIPVQEYRNGPIEEIAIHFVRINRVIEEKAPRNQTARSQHPVSRVRFSARPGNPHQRNSSRPGFNKGTVLSGRQQHVDNPRRLQILSKEVNPPLGNNYGRRPWNQQNVQRPAIFWWPNRRADIEQNCQDMLRLPKRR